MIHGWRHIAEAAPGPIAAFAAADPRHLVCASLAGIALSRDGGATWHWPLPGTIGPFVADVAAVSRHGQVSVYAAGPSNLYRSSDGGDTWAAVEIAAARVVAMDGERALIVLADGGLAAARDHDRALRIRRLDAPGHITTLALGRHGDVWWIVAAGELWGSVDSGESWQRRAGPTGTALEEIAVCASGSVLATGVDGSLHLWRESTGWAAVPAASGVPFGPIACASLASTLAAGGPGLVLVSTDDGGAWETQSIDGVPTTLALTPDGTVLLVGCADSDCLRIRIGVHETVRLASVPASVVTGITAVPGLVATSGIGGASLYRESEGSVPWAIVDGLEGFVPLAMDGGSRRMIVATAAGILDESGAAVASTPTSVPTVVAVSDRGARRLAVSDGESIWAATAEGAADSGSVSWALLERPPAKGRILGLAFGSPGANPASLPVAVMVDADDHGSVWALRDGRWRELATGTANAGLVHVAAAPGTRGLFAAIGNALFRPALIGELLLAPEHPGGIDGDPILGLAASSGKESVSVAALTRRTIWLSDSRGLDWQQIGLPAGPPVTAIAMRRSPALEIVAVQLGGAIVARDVPGDAPPV